MKNLFNRSILFAAVVAMCVACNTNNPESKELIGTWSDPVQVYIRTFVFCEDGALLYTYAPDPRWDGAIPAEAGDGATLHYMVTENNQLCISGEYVDDLTMEQTFDTIPFMFLTNFQIKGNTLTLDSFAYDGGINSRFDKNLILYKR